MNVSVTAPLLALAILLLAACALHPEASTLVSASSTIAVLLLMACSAHSAAPYANHAWSEMPPDQLTETEWMLVYDALNNTAGAAGAGDHDLSAQHAVEEGAWHYCAIASAQRWRTVPFEKCGRMVSALSKAYARADVLGVTLNKHVMEFCVLGGCKTRAGDVVSEMNLEEDGAGTPVTYHRAPQRVR